MLMVRFLTLTNNSLMITTGLRLSNSQRRNETKVIYSRQYWDLQQKEFFNILALVRQDVIVGDNHGATGVLDQPVYI